MNPVFCHSPALRAVRGERYPVRVAADPAIQSVSATCGGEKFSLSPVGETEGLRIWRTSLPISAAAGEALAYTLYADLVQMESYVVPLCRAALAPLAITELFVRPKGAQSPYVEVMNTTDAPIDLGAYQLLGKQGTPGEEGTVVALPIAPRMGEAILPPHSVAVLWLAFAQTHNAKQPCLTAADFCDRLSAAYGHRGLALDPEQMQIIRIEACAQGEDGVWRNLPDVPELPKFRPWDSMTFGIAPLGGSLTDAVCRMTVNTHDLDTWDWDTPVNRSSNWMPDFFGGADMVRVCGAADPTPGRLDAGQCVPDPVNAEPLCIIPLEFPELYPLSSGALTLRWRIEGGEARASSLHLLDGGSETVLSAVGEAGVWRVTLDAAQLCRLERLCAFIEADNGIYTTRYASPSQPVCIPLLDNAGPMVTRFLPENGYASLAGGEVAFAADYYDRSGIDTLSCHLYLDGAEVSGQAAWTQTGVRCTFSSLSPGKHKLALKLYDCLGNSSRSVSYFTVADPELMYCFRGEVHAHTADSDGVGTPEEAMTYARDVGLADFFAVTDHSHYLSPARYAEQRAIADRFNEPGRFAALYGWEMTWNNECGYWGHMNLLNTDFIHNDIRSMDMPGLFASLKDDADVIAMFNHPGYSWGNFDEFNFHTPESDALVCLDEIKGPVYDNPHALALTKGWHVAPVSSEDNHAFNWTTATTQTGYVLAPALTRQNVIEAFRARRTYTTSDPELHLRFRINGAWLGSRIPATDMLTVDMRLDTSKPEGIGVVSLVGEDNIVVAEWDVGAGRHFERRIHIPAEFDYYYLRVINPLVPKSYTAGAPVWLEGRDQLALAPLELALTGGDQPNLVKVSVSNPYERSVTELRVDFYLTSEAGFSLDHAEPYRTAYLGSLAAGGTVSTGRTFPNLPAAPACRRVTAVVRGKLGGRVLTSTAYLLLTPASIVEVLPDCSAAVLPDGEKIERPYTYAVLFNHTNQPLDLGAYQLRLWTATGKAPLPENRFPLTGVTVAPRSAAVLWLRPAGGSPLTAADFNAHYGVGLREGENLFLLDFKPLSASRQKAQRLDLALGDEVLSRVEWNLGASFGMEPTTDRALRYGRAGGITATSPMLDSAVDPKPGQLVAAQIPASSCFIEPKNELKLAHKLKKKEEKSSRKPMKAKAVSGTAAAIGLGAAGMVVGAGSMLLAVLLGSRRKKQGEGEGK